jgi:peroxiredoxin
LKRRTGLTSNASHFCWKGFAMSDSHAYSNASLPSGVLAPGTPAPDFRLPTTPDQSVSLSDFRGAPLILAFYPADWSPVCGDELALFNEVLPEFHRFHATLLGISVDGVWCHLAFEKDRKLRFPLLADFEPKGAVSRLYGAYRPHDGVCERALYLIDAQGIIRWSYLSPIGISPGVDGILEALENLFPEQEDKPHDQAFDGQSHAGGQRA